MRDRVLFPLMGVAALAMIALALVWPQGEGARSPAPFGHPMTPPPPAPGSVPAKPQPVLGMAPAALAPAPASAPAAQGVTP